MSNKKKSFILYDGDIECVDHLTTNQAGLLLKAIVNLRMTGEMPDFDDDTALKILFHQISSHMAMNEEKYRQTCERNAKAAQKRWQSKSVPKNTDASERIKTDANRCYNDNDNDNGIDIDNVNDMDNDIENDASAPTSYNCAEPPVITVDSLLAKYRKILAERSS
jgi:hypothetical protein